MMSEREQKGPMPPAAASLAMAEVEVGEVWLKGFARPLRLLEGLPGVTACPPPRPPPDDQPAAYFRR
jgi:hypothetical protein